MGNPIPDDSVLDDFHSQQLKFAIAQHKESLQDGVSREAEVEAALKEYAIHQKRSDTGRVYTLGNFVRGIYYLTFAKWTDRPKYDLAWKAYGWLQ